MFTTDLLHAVARDRSASLLGSRARRHRPLPGPVRPAAPVLIVRDDHGRTVALSSDGVACDLEPTTPAASTR